MSECEREPCLADFPLTCRAVAEWIGKWEGDPLPGLEVSVRPHSFPPSYPGAIRSYLDVAMALGTHRAGAAFFAEEEEGAGAAWVRRRVTQDLDRARGYLARCAAGADAGECRS